MTEVNGPMLKSGRRLPHRSAAIGSYKLPASPAVLPLYFTAERDLGRGDPLLKIRGKNRWEQEARERAWNGTSRRFLHG
jgi:hypothetical protein